MSATRPATKTELRDYALRRLGYPTIDINVASAQLDDLIEEAIDYYQEYHYNGSYKAFIKIEVTDAIKTAAKTGSAITGTDWTEGNEYLSHHRMSSLLHMFILRLVLLVSFLGIFSILNIKFS